MVRLWALALVISWALFCCDPALAQVERGTFDTSPFSLGILTEGDGALGRDLWGESSAADIAEHLGTVPTRFDDPAKRMMLRRVLLSPGDGPTGADGSLAGLKLLRASEAGYFSEAAALAELTPGLVVQPEISQIVTIGELYRGDLTGACRRLVNLREGRQAPFFLKLRAMCYIHVGEAPAAELTLDLAREEGVLSDAEETMFRNLLRQQPTSDLPEGPLEYAAFRKLGGLFLASDVARLAPAEVAAVALDTALAPAAREAALLRAGREELLPVRELGDIAASLKDTLIGREVALVRAMEPGSDERGAAIARSLADQTADPDEFFLRVKIFSTEIVSMRPTIGTIPYAAEMGIAALLLRRTDAAERWMQTVAAEQSIGADRAFLNLAKLYAYLDYPAAQRLAGAIGEDLDEPGLDRINSVDGLAVRQGSVALPALVGQALAASKSGGQAPALLTALSASALNLEGEGAAIRDEIAKALFEQGDGIAIAREAAFREKALEFADKIREETIEKAAYIPRLKPQRVRRR